MKDTQRATQDEVAQAVQSAVAAATAGQVTRGDIEEVVAKSVQEAASGGLTSCRRSEDCRQCPRGDIGIH